VALLSLIYSIWEFTGVCRLVPSAFSRGPVVVVSVRDLQHPLMKALPSRRVLTASGQFRLVSNSECVFSRRMLWLGSLAPTPVPIKGRIRWSGGRAEIVYRTPLGVSVFVCAGLLAWPIPPLLLYVGGKAPALDAALMAGVPVSFIVGTLALCLYLEVRKAHQIVAEIDAHLRERGQD
jgi:hypothetical protein